MKCRVILALLAVLAAFPAAAEMREISFYPSSRVVPSVPFVDGQGHKVTLADFKGKLVVVDFWATWCVPCRQEFPAFDRLQEALGDKNILVVPISIDRKGMLAVDKFYEETKPTHLGRYLDDGHDLSDAMGIRGLPTTVIIGPDGGEIGRVEGPADWDQPKLRQELIKRSGR